MIDAGDLKWSNVSQTFTFRFFNEETLQRVLNKLSDLRIENFRKKENPDEKNGPKRLALR